MLLAVEDEGLQAQIAEKYTRAASTTLRRWDRPA
jgi:hypothetical protein